MGRLRENVIDKIKQLINLGYKDYQIVEEVRVSRQTVAKYRYIVLEESEAKKKTEKAARIAKERRRKEERDKEIRNQKIASAHTRALKRQEEEQAEENRLQRMRIQRQIQERAEERARQKKADLELQAYFTKAEAEDRESFMETYNLLYDLREKAALTKTKEQFTKIVEVFGFPYSEFVYTEQEKSGLPLMLMDRGSMNTFLKMGLWPYSQDPLTEMIESMKALNEPSQASFSIDQAFLIEMIKENPFIFVALGRTG